jgi:hypothetical protein
MGAPEVASLPFAQAFLGGKALPYRDFGPRKTAAHSELHDSKWSQV